MSELAELCAIVDSNWKHLGWVGDEAGGFETVDRVECDDRRWSRTIEAIVKAPSGQLFAFDWEEGLTEVQENDCDFPNVRAVRLVERTVIMREYPLA